MHTSKSTADALIQVVAIMVSVLLRRHNNHAGVLSQLYRGVDWTDEAILDHALDGQRPAILPFQVSFHRQRLGVSREIGRWNRRLGSGLLVKRSTFGAPLIKTVLGSHVFSV